MSDSNKFLLYSGGLFIVIATLGYRYGYSFDKSRQIYEIVAYLVLYNFVVALFLVKPLQDISRAKKIFMVSFIGLVILGQLIGDSRKFYPFSSWTMYSGRNPAGIVYLMSAIDKERNEYELNSKYFSPARSSRPHEQFFRISVMTRSRNYDRYNTLMRYYCDVLDERGIDANKIEISVISYNNEGISATQSLSTFSCK